MYTPEYRGVEIYSRSCRLGVDKNPLERGYTRDWLPAYSFVLRARARRDTTRQDCFVVIPPHIGVTIVYCGTVVPSCSCMGSDVVWCLINKLMFLSSWHTLVCAL
jgi:hypothetical protein